MKNLSVLGLGLFLLIIESVATTLFDLHPFTPNLLLPLVLYLGVSQDVELLRGAALSFVLGYLLDSFSGSPMGLQTLVLVATFLLSRVAGFSLFARSIPFQMGLSFAVGIVAGGTIVALRAIFEQDPPSGGVRMVVQTILAPALGTALPAPLIFNLMRRVDALVGRRTRDGVLTT